MTNLLDKFSLIVKHLKTEVFHFSRSHGPFNPPPLDLSPLGGLILSPKNSWKYLEFIFDRKLTFHQHVNFYSNRALSLVKCMKLLGNSSCGISPLQKCLLYRCCILPIALYGFQLWFYHRACYKTKVWTDFSRDSVLLYKSYTRFFYLNNSKFLWL